MHISNAKWKVDMCISFVSLPYNLYISKYSRAVFSKVDETMTLSFVLLCHVLDDAYELPDKNADALSVFYRI